MIRKAMICALAATVLTISSAAFAQQSPYGSAAEAKAMLEEVVVAVQADKAKALSMFNKGEGGFKDRDLQPFCFDVSDGKIVSSTHPSLLGTDVQTLKDKTDKAFGQELYNAATDGKITEVSYMFPRPGEDVPVQKVSFVTGVSDIGCGVGYFK